MADYVKWLRGKVGHDTIIFCGSLACITNDKGEILLQKRSGTEEVWGLPGGILEIGDSAEEATIREVKEETGLDVKVDYMVGFYSKYFCSYANGDNAQVVCSCFKCTIVGGDIVIDNKETFDLRFFSKENIPELFIQQHTDMVNDFFDGKMGVYR